MLVTTRPAQSFWVVCHPPPVIQDLSSDEEAGFAHVEFAGLSSTDPRTYKQAMAGSDADNVRGVLSSSNIFDFILFISYVIWSIWVSLETSRHALSDGTKGTLVRSAVLEISRL